jgi:type III pantothenate kinase
MTLCLDIGNSATKAGLFDGGSLLRTLRTTRLDAGMLSEFISDDRLERAGIASVVPAATPQVAALVAAVVPRPPLVVSASVRLPFEMAYRTPETLGADRIAAAAGGRSLLPEADPLVTIDAGSAVTVEVVAGGRFLGGAIAPGPELLYRALSERTAQLPALHPALSATVIGSSTEESIRAGIGVPFIEGLRGLLRRIGEELDAPLTVVACGGWGESIAAHLNEITHVEPHLLLHGIRALVELNG